MNSSRHFRAAFAVLFLVSALVLSSCEERAAVVGVDTAPIRAWVGGPMDGSEIPMGTNSALCHGFAIAGVSQIELWVNGSFANRMANPDPSEQYFTSELGFDADAAGAYALECVTTDQDGLNAWSEPSTVFVTGEEPSPTTPSEIPTATPTATEVPPTEVPPTSTSVPPTPTSTSVPPTSTSIPPTSTPSPSPTRVPPSIVSFEVSKSQITLGECVTFSYEVAGSPDAIFFDGGGVAGPSGSVDRCPTVTRSWELTAQVGGQVVDSASLTVVVIQPSPSPGDTTGPSITQISESSDPIAWPDANCSPYYYPNQVTISAQVTDQTGVDGVKLTYRVVRGTATGSWQALAMTGQGGYYSVIVGPSQLSLSMSQPAGAEQNGQLQYYLQAYDELGYKSESGTGTVTIVHCYIPR